MYFYQWQRLISKNSRCLLVLNKKGETTMKQNLINDVIQEMLLYLNNSRTEKLQSVMQHILF